MNPPEAQDISFQDRRLKYLYVSHERGSMRAAADELGIAASSISRHIAKLEKELGVELVMQGTHKITLTEAGEIALDYYLTRVHHHEAMLARLQELRTRQRNTAIIAIGEGLLGARALGKLHTFLREHPDVRAEIISAPSFEVQRMLADDEANLGVIFSPSPSAPLSRLASFAQPLRLIAHQSNPLAERACVTLADLSQEPLILPGPKFRVREILDQACHGTPYRLAPSIVSNSLAVILDFVRGGMGSTLLAELAVGEDIKSGTFKAIPIDCPAMESTEIQIVTRHSRPLNAVGQALARELANAIRYALV